MKIIAINEVVYRITDEQYKKLRKLCDGLTKEFHNHEVFNKLNEEYSDMLVEIANTKKRVMKLDDVFVFT